GRCRRGLTSMRPALSRPFCGMGSCCRLTRGPFARQSLDCCDSEPSMADELTAIPARIHGVLQLDTVIGAMRALPSATGQPTRTLLPVFRTYAEVVAEALAYALRLREVADSRLATEAARRARVVFCAELGFVGPFVERMLDEIADRPPAEHLLIGSRGI